MSCTEQKMRQNILADVQPGNYSIDVSYNLLNARKVIFLHIFELVSLCSYGPR